MKSWIVENPVLLKLNITLDLNKVLFSDYQESKTLVQLTQEVSFQIFRNAVNKKNHIIPASLTETSSFLPKRFRFLLHCLFSL